MGFFDFFKRKKEEDRSDPADLIEVKPSPRISLYGGLCAIIADHIALTIGELMIGIIWSALEGSPRYAIVHDFAFKRRPPRFRYWKARSKRHIFFIQRQERKSLKALGLRVIAI